MKSISREAVEREAVLMERSENFVRARKMRALRTALDKAEVEHDRLREVLSELLQVFDGLPMLGIDASRRGEAARTVLRGGKP
jgi:hypothetical protein